MRTTRTKVAFVGCGYTKATRKPRQSEVDYAIEACRMALEDAGMKPEDVDGINVQVHHYPPPDMDAITFGLGMTNVRWTREGGLGILPAGIAATAIDNGECNSVLVVKIMNTIAPVSTPQIDPTSGGVAGPTQFEVPYGLGYSMQRVGLMARRYMHRYGITPEQLAWVPIVEREHALTNPWAVMDTPMTLDDYLSARFIADPVRLFDCDMPVNGAFAFLMTREDIARGLKHPPVFLKSWAGAQDVPRRDHLLPDDDSDSTPIAKEIYRDAGLGPEDMDLWFMYDGFSFFVPMWMENLGLVPRGEAGNYIEGGDNIRAGTGRHPINTHGGQLSEGRLHGHGHVLEAVQQLRGSAGSRQVAHEANTAVISSVFPWTGAAGILAID